MAGLGRLHIIIFDRPLQQIWLLTPVSLFNVFLIVINTILRNVFKVNTGNLFGNFVQAQTSKEGNCPLRNHEVSQVETANVWKQYHHHRHISINYNEPCGKV